MQDLPGIALQRRFSQHVQGGRYVQTGQRRRHMNPLPASRPHENITPGLPFPGQASKLTRYAVFGGIRMLGQMGVFGQGPAKLEVAHSQITLGYGPRHTLHKLQLLPPNQGILQLLQPQPWACRYDHQLKSHRLACCGLLDPCTITRNRGCGSDRLSGDPDSFWSSSNLRGMAFTTPTDPSRRTAGPAFVGPDRRVLG